MATTTSINVPSTKIYLEPGEATTCKTTGAVVGGTFVKVSTGGLGNHPTVVTATAAGPKYGVAHFDAPSGAEVSVLREGTVGVYAVAALTSGQEVEVGAGGKAAALTAGKAVGVCVADTAINVLAPITLY